MDTGAIISTAIVVAFVCFAIVGYVMLRKWSRRSGQTSPRSMALTKTGIVVYAATGIAMFAGIAVISFAPQSWLGVWLRERVPGGEFVVPLLALIVVQTVLRWLGYPFVKFEKINDAA